MANLKAMILDDDHYAGVLLRKKLLDQITDIEIVALCTDPVTALKEFSGVEADVLFLDVEMPGLNGFQFLEALSGFDFEVIFTTAHNSYTIEALRVSAVDYLLKPVAEEDLMAAVTRLRSRLQSKRAAKPKQNSSGFTSKKLSLPTAEGVYFVDKSAIVRVEAMSNYSIFYFANGRKMVVSRTLREFELALENDGFARVNRSHLVNSAYIQLYRKGQGGTIEMTDGMEIGVSPQMKEALMARLLGD